MSPAAHAAAKKSRQPGPDGRARGRGVVFGFVPSLDGLRALAVLGVMLYHGGAPFLGGGFLTIDVFFVLSGFLITTLLVGEWRTARTIRLGQFWARRVRRLLPALLVMLVGVAVFAKLLATPGEFAGLRLDALSALFYVANWHFIMAHANYFAVTGQPSPLQHTWSLSIEEQFYIVWPLAVLGLLALGSRLRAARRLWPLLAVTVAGALASAAEMHALYRGPASVMRVYEGTDTRAQDLLVGAALAVGMALWAERRRALPSGVPAAAAAVAPGRAHPSTGTVGAAGPRHRQARRPSHRRGPTLRPITAWEVDSRWGRAAVQVVGWSAVAAFAVVWSHLSGPSPFLFRGGYLLVALGVAAVIFCSVADQRGALARAIGNRPFRYVGKISYGAYLWHFPLFFVLDASRTHLVGYPLLAVRVGVTLVVASGSYYLVEEPLRRGRGRSLTEWRAWLATSGAFAGVVAVTVAATLPTAVSAAAGTRPTGAQFSGPPVKAIVFGDSVAYRLASAMILAQPTQTYDVSLDNAAIVGCGVVRSTEYLAHGVPADSTAACNTSTPPDAQWPALWRGELDRVHPNVAVLLAGRWEVTDRLIGGKWMHIGQPAFDAVLKQSLEQAVQVATSTGALMILMTSPCFDSGEQPDGQPWPEDSPARLAEYDAIVRQVAAEHPATVEVDDFGSLVCPGGHYEVSIDGVQIRDADGVHIVPTVAAGQWLAARVLPEVVRVGRIEMAGRDLTGAAPP